MSLIRECVTQNASKQGKYLNKHTHFIEIYEKLLEPYKDKSVSVVECGINHGGSLQLWRDYLGDKAIVYGLDNAEHSLYSDERIQCFLIDQSNQEDLNKLSGLIPHIDIFIDDGSHYSKDQIMTFEKVFPLLSQGGLYIIEDTHTSYRSLYNSSYKHQDSFIEYSKNIIDSMYKNEDERISPNIHTTSIASITFYYAMVVICKV